jgi:hydrogenase maturation protease
VVLACGDELRGDDGVAAHAVRALPPEALAGAEVRIVDALQVEDLVALPQEARVVIVDAVAGPPAGQLVELDLAVLGSGGAGSGGAGQLESVASSHQLPLAEVLALAGLLRGQPLAGRFVGVGIRSVAFGSGLSEPVVAALPALTAAAARAVLQSAAPSPRRHPRDTLAP